MRRLVELLARKVEAAEMQAEAIRQIAYHLLSAQTEDYQAVEDGAYSAADLALSIVERWLEVVDPPLQLSDKQSRALQWLIVAVLTKAAREGT